MGIDWSANRSLFGSRSRHCYAIKWLPVLRSLPLKQNKIKIKKLVGARGCPARIGPKTDNSSRAKGTRAHISDFGYQALSSTKLGGYTCVAD
jgi:hypothetical protein